MLNLGAILLLTSLTIFSLSSFASQKPQKLANAKPIGAETIPSLKLVTWNVEHLAYPTEHGCKGRNTAELAQLKQYAQALDADIFALQEVASKQAVAQIFPTSEWNIVMSFRADSEPYTCRRSGKTSTQQKVAFAVRKHLNIVKVAAFEPLGLEMPGLRYGLEMQIETPSGLVTLLNVHLKSGCFVDDYRSADSEACSIFAKQVPVLTDWISQQSQPFVILGDFNHRLSTPNNRLKQELFDANQETSPSLQLATASLVSCHPRYPDPIDHIILGRMRKQGTKLEVISHHFENMQEDAMLSDHCAISVSL